MKQRLTLRTKMKMSTKMVIITTSVVVVFIGSFLIFNFSNLSKSRAGTTITAATTGDWDNTTTWVGGVVPGPADEVIITPIGASNITVTVKASVSCAKLTVTATDKTASLHINDGNTFTVSGDVTLYGGIGSAKVAQIIVKGNSSGTDAIMNINGNLNIVGNLSSKNAVFSLNGKATANLKGAINLPVWPLNYGKIDCSNNSRFNFNGTSLQLMKLIGNGSGDIKYGNLHINNIKGVKLESDITSSNVKGDIVIQSGKLLTNGKTIALGNNNIFEVDDGATFTTTTTGATAGLPFGSTTHIFKTSSIVEFAGSAQTIPALPSGQNYGYLVVSASGTKSLAANVIVISGIQISNGYLDLNGHTLTLRNALSSAITRVAGGIISEKTDNSSVLKWKIGAGSGSRTVPFITSSGNYIPVTLNITTAGSGSGDFNFSTYPTGTNNTPFPSSPIGVTNLNTNGANNSVEVADRFWLVTDNAYVTLPKSTITLVATTSEVSGISNLIVQHWNSTNNTWDSPLSGQSATATSASVPFINNYGIFVLSNKAHPLPIELYSFNAKIDNSQAVLNWKTAQEVNNNFFTIERSTDGANFIAVGTMKGHNNSNIILEYTFVDKQLVNSANIYYRLKQTDFDERYSYSNIISLKNTLSNKAEETLVINNIFPNPFQDKANVNYNVEDGGVINIEVIDLQGKVVFKESKMCIAGENVYEFNNGESLNNGAYMLIIKHNNKAFAKKILKG